MASFSLGQGSSTIEEWVKTTPTRTPTPSGDVLVPFAQAGITALVSSMVVAGGSIIWHWPWYISVASFAIVFAGSWLYLLADHRSLLRTVETITNQPAKPAPTQQHDVVHMDITEHNGPNSDTMRFMDLPVDQATLAHIAQGVLAGHKFSERQWAGRGRPMSGPKFRELQDKLLGAGYVRYVHPRDTRQGVELTNKGRALFTSLSHSPTAFNQTYAQNTLDATHAHARTHEICL
jgi:hypothetical protein